MGPGLPPNVRESRDLFVVEEDLRELVRGKGGPWHELERADAWARSRELGLSPTAYRLQLVLRWCAEEARGALQASTDFLAALLGCHRSHVYRALHELDGSLGLRDPGLRRGGEFSVDRHGRARFIGPLEQRAAQADHARDWARHNRQLVRTPKPWTDARGREHVAADARAVTHATPEGLRQCFRAPKKRRAWLPRGLRPRAYELLCRVLKRAAVAVRQRLRPVGKPRPSLLTVLRASLGAHKKETPSKGNEEATGQIWPIAVREGGPGGGFSPVGNCAGPPGGGGGPFGADFGRPAGSPGTLPAAAVRPGVGPIGEGGALPLCPKDAPTARTGPPEGLRDAMERAEAQLRAMGARRADGSPL